jgi:hypothetical protein
VVDPVYAADLARTGNGHALGGNIAERAAHTLASHQSERRANR